MLFKPDEGRTDDLGNKEFVIKVAGGPTKHNRYYRRRNPFFTQPKSSTKPKIANDAYSELVSTLRQARYARSMTQAQLAKAVGSNQPAISRFETGSTNPSVKFLLSYAKAVEKNLGFSLKNF